MYICICIYVCLYIRNCMCLVHKNIFSTYNYRYIQGISTYNQATIIVWFTVYVYPLHHGNPCYVSKSLLMDDRPPRWVCSIQRAKSWHIQGYHRDRIGLSGKAGLTILIGTFRWHIMNKRWFSDKPKYTSG